MHDDRKLYRGCAEMFCVLLHFIQGGEHARRSALLDSDEPFVYYYDDVRTAYEIFQRGMHVSSEY